MRGSPQLLAYQPVIYVKILAKRVSRRGSLLRRGLGRAGVQEWGWTRDTDIRDNDSPWVWNISYLESPRTKPAWAGVIRPPPPAHTPPGRATSCSMSLSDQATDLNWASTAHQDGYWICFKFTYLKIECLTFLGFDSYFSEEEVCWASSHPHLMNS